MKDKKSYFLLFLTVLLIFILLGLVAFFSYDKITHGDIGVQENRIYGNNIENKNEVLIESNDQLDIIKSELENDYFIQFIISHDNLNNITNQDILEYLIILATSQSQINTNVVSASVLKDLYKNSLLNISYVDENIGLHWKYNRDNLNYIKISGNNNALEIVPIFKKLNTYAKKNNTYLLSYKYGFILKENLLEVYGTYINVKNQIDSIYSVNKEISRDEIINYLNANYQTLKDKMDTYNYVVEVIDNKIKITNFYIS